MTNQPTVGPTISVEKQTRSYGFVTCPHCNKGEHRVDHCKPGFSSSWYCDECGGRFHIELHSETKFLLTPLAEKKIKTLVTLESAGPVRLLVEGMSFTRADGTSDGKEESRAQYFYDEHTCPTNFLGDVVKVIDPADGDDDPHGIFAFVKVEPWRDVENDDEVARIA